MIAIILGTLTGLVMGLSGAGGAVLAIPALMWGLNWPLNQAAPVALLAVCAAAAFGTWMSWDVRFVRYRAASLMAAAGLLAAPLGLQLSILLPASILEAVFATVLLLAALRFFTQKDQGEAQLVPGHKGDDDPGRSCGLDPLTGRIHWTPRCILAIGGGGLLTGFLAGLLGVGGGFVIVPALRMLTPLSMHSAIATALMAIALTSAGTIALALLQGRSLPLLIALPFVLGTGLGMLIGRRLAPRIPALLLQRGFAGLMLLVCLMMASRAAGLI